MITVRAYQGKTVAVFGLARSGLAAVRALIAGGARVIAWDDNADKCNAARDLGADIADLNTLSWQGIAALVASPGVPLTHPQPHAVIAAAKAAGVAVIGDMELFAKARAALPGTKVVAVTGTNGKSTTTALIGHILTEAGMDVAVGGNIGHAVLDLEPLPAGGVYVLEMSSYQIDLTQVFVPDVAVLLNITPDHLDRHGGMEGYVAAKERLFAGQNGSDVAVIGVDDEYGADFAARLVKKQGPKVIAISAEKKLPHGISATGGIVVDGQAVGDVLSAPALRGAHNWQNAAAAFAACRSLGVAADIILAACKSFPGLAHRMERAGAVGGIEFINDSKATNLDAAAKALAAFDPIYWIAGGRPKSTDLSPLAMYFPRIRKAYLIGEASDDFARTLEGALPFERCGTLDIATTRAALDALGEGAPEPVVLLSPACASYDQFANFEARGDAFRGLVEGLPAVIAARKGGLT